MTDDERKENGLVKELKYRYTFASGDFNFLGEKENTNYLRALARLGLRMDDGENDKYFTPESIAEIKKWWALTAKTGIISEFKKNYYDQFNSAKFKSIIN